MFFLSSKLADDHIINAFHGFLELHELKLSGEEDIVIIANPKVAFMQDGLLRGWLFKGTKDKGMCCPNMILSTFSYVIKTTPICS